MKKSMTFTLTLFLTFNSFAYINTYVRYDDMSVCLADANNECIDREDPIVNDIALMGKVIKFGTESLMKYGKKNKKNKKDKDNNNFYRLSYSLFEDGTGIFIRYVIERPKYPSKQKCMTSARYLRLKAIQESNDLAEIDDLKCIPGLHPTH